MKIIGLTGNSGTGKSTVSKIFSENGGFIIDADKIAHENMQPKGLSYNEIIETFGTTVLSDNKEIDRKKLGEIVFSDKEELAKLNEISLKYILKKISDTIDYVTKNPDDTKFIVVDAPLLIETGLNYIVNEVWVICADYDIRVSRIMQRDNLTSDYAKKRLENQTSQEELSSYADVIIENNDISIDELSKQVLSKLNLHF